MPNHPEGADSSLPVLLQRCLSHLRRAHRIPEETASEVFSRISFASRDEIEAGLHVLWPFARHITREQCWTELYFASSQGLDVSLARGDIRAWIAEYGTKRQREFPRNLEQIGPTLVSVKQRLDSYERLRTGIREINASFYPGEDPLLRYLPDIKAHWSSSRWYQDDNPDPLGMGFSFLYQLTTEIRHRIDEDNPLFWGVLGRFLEISIDDDPDLLDRRVSSGWAATLDERVHDRRADLYDYWLYLEDSEDMAQDERDLATEGMLAYVQRISAEECEEFFTDLDVGRGFPPPAETVLPHADRLWEAILKKDNLSRKLLGRAGFYYWRTRHGRSGPSLALAACGYECEGEMEERWNLPPFQPFWAAAQSAATEKKWEFAAVCLARALLDMALFLVVLDRETLARLHTFAFDPRFIQEIYAHQKPVFESHDSPVRVYLHLTREALANSEIGEWSQLAILIHELCRRFNVTRREDDSRTIVQLLGRELYESVQPQTRLFLIEAEARWSSAGERDGEDYSAVTLNYRKAIEAEWREHLEPTLRDLGQLADRKSVTFGELLRAVGNLPSIAERALRHALLPDTRLFDRLFLQRIWKEYLPMLNRAAHGRVTRRECLQLRRDFLERKLLRDLLASVQPATH